MEKQSNLRLSCGILHKVYNIYWDIKSMDKFKSTKKTTPIQPQDAPINEYTLKNTMKVNYELHDLQLQPYQFWNF